MYGSQNKQRLFHYEALTDWFSIEKNNQFSVVHNAYSQLDAQTTCFGLNNPSSGVFIQDKQQRNAMT